MAYPEPLVYPPCQLPHKHTFIILHGRGSSAGKFGLALLNTPIQLPDSTEHTTLCAAFPHARFVFPTAPKRRATLYGRTHTNQWFDNWKLDSPATAREEMQAPGLRETVAYLHGLLHAEAAVVPGGMASIVLGGLSQGCAAALVTLLLWEGESIAAVFGMCGWLPYAARLGEEVFEEKTDEVGGGDAVFDDPFERSEDSTSNIESDPPRRAIDWLREEIQLERYPLSQSELVSQKTPVFLGHGVEDERVNVVLGRAASGCLQNLGVEVVWKEYPSLGHWYSGEMLCDLVLWVKARMGARNG